MQDPHVHRDPAYQQPHAHEPVGEPASGWTGYAAVKYGAIIVVTIAILVFLWLVITRIFD